MAIPIHPHSDPRNHLTRLCVLGRVGFGHLENVRGGDGVLAVGLLASICACCFFESALGVIVIWLAGGMWCIVVVPPFRTFRRRSALGRATGEGVLELKVE
eukprot:scaffold16956_cov73-Attheya_sp.AAC.1